jgi:tetratricopeptide (TPR) repeat protein
MPDRLRALWDFADLELSERRLRAQLAREVSATGRAEVLSQLARVEALRDRFEEGERLLAEAEALADTSAGVRARTDLERGRLLRSSGDQAAALAPFERAFAAALEAGEHFIAADAAHMAALAAADPALITAWTERGIELAEASDEARYWLGPLLNNLGWTLYEAGEYQPALDAFRRGLAAREREPDRPLEIEIARYAVGKTLRTLGRPEEAAPLLEQAVAWADSQGRPDPYFHEELGEIYGALGRTEEAREHAGEAERIRELLELG